MRILQVLGMVSGVNYFLSGVIVLLGVHTEKCYGLLPTALAQFAKVGAIWAVWTALFWWIG